MQTPLTIGGGEFFSLSINIKRVYVFVFFDYRT